MYGVLIVVAVVLGLYIGVLKLLERRHVVASAGAYHWFIIGIILLSFAVTAFGFLGEADVFPVERHHVNFDTELVAVKDNQSVTGRFFMFAGLLNGEPTYYFYRVEGSGYILDHSDVDRTVVYEDTVDEAYIRHVTEPVTPAFKARWLHWFVFADSLHHGWELHVPAGTIQRSFILDAE